MKYLCKQQKAGGTHCCHHHGLATRYKANLSCTGTRWARAEGFPSWAWSHWTVTPEDTATLIHRQTESHQETCPSLHRS